jgi:hypothetical protein
VRHFVSSCLIAAAALAVAAPATAQQQPPPPEHRPGLSPPMPQRNIPDRMMRNDSAWTRAEFETFLDAASGHNLPSQPLARVDLANRVSTLMELGRCTDAREEARAAGDRMMALRARQLCRTDRDG